MVTTFIGVDVSKEYLDIFDGKTGRCGRVSREEIPLWCASVAARAEPAMLVCEATGVYSKRLIKQLQAQGIAWSEANPRHVRRFAQACGMAAKSDRIDAQVIARYAQACGVREGRLQSAAALRLRTLVTRREQVLAMILMERGHLETTDDAALNEGIRTHIAHLTAQQKALETSIGAALQADARVPILLSMPGIGNTTAAALLAHLPELGTLNRGQAAALAGLAPFVRDSGSFKGKRCIYGGRAPVRRALYMAALVAIRHNPRFKALYMALKENGKPFKVAITAIMRKMLETLNAMCKRQMTFQML